MTVIELGLVTDGGDQPPSDHERRPLGRRDVRRALVAVVALFSVLTVTGSARPDPKGLPQLWSIPYTEGADTFMLDAGNVYVLSQPDGSRITAYDSRTGARRWSTQGVTDTTWMGWARSGVLLMPAGFTTTRYQDVDGSEVSREFSRETVALDTATGRVLWRRTGEFSVAVSGRALLTEWNAEGSKARTFQVVRVSDGATVWSRPAAGLETWATDWMNHDSSDRLVAAAPDGRIEVFDLSDGRLVAGGTVPWVRQSTADNEFTSLSIDGHRLYIDRSMRERTAVTAYDTETLGRLWEVERPSSGGVYGCGPVLCVNGPDDTAGYDRDTGEVRWRLAGAANGFPMPGGRVLLDDDETGARHHLVDGATGKRLADLGAAVPVWNATATDLPYLLRRTKEPPGLMSISRIDEDTGEELLRGTLPQVLDYGCQSEDDLLVCATPDSRLVVTDVG